MKSHSEGIFHRNNYFIAIIKRKLLPTQIQHPVSQLGDRTDRGCQSLLAILGKALFLPTAPLLLL